MWVSFHLFWDRDSIWNSVLHYQITGSSCLIIDMLVWNLKKYIAWLSRMRFFYIWSEISMTKKEISITRMVLLVLVACHFCSCPTSAFIRLFYYAVEMIWYLHCENGFSCISSYSCSCLASAFTQLFLCCGKLLIEIQCLRIVSLLLSKVFMVFLVW